MKYLIFFILIGLGIVHPIFLLVAIVFLFFADSCCKKQECEVVNPYDNLSWNIQIQDDSENKNIKHITLKPSSHEINLNSLKINEGQLLGNDAVQIINLLEDTDDVKILFDLKILKDNITLRGINISRLPNTKKDFYMGIQYEREADKKE